MENMPFKVGDRVIHPQHGLGEVTDFTVKEFVQGEKRPFYEVSFPGITLWVPLKLSTSGIRKLSVKSEISRCRKLLEAPAASLNANPRLRQVELSDHLKEGTLASHCEVVRDLSAYGRQNNLNRASANFLKVTQDVLCQEWAAVEEKTLVEAADEIEALLEKSGQASDGE